jgi:DNA polymerase IV
MIPVQKKNDILLCDLDAFYASVEQADHPELQGKPVIVGGAKGSRGVATTCSYEARKYGVKSAMPIRRAVELCPDGVFLPVNMKRYQAVSRQVGEIFARFTPEIETVSIDEAYLAVKKGSGFATGEMIRTAVNNELGLCISIGVSENKLLAKIACELAKPDNIRALWPDEVPQVLWPLPARVIPGVGPVTEKKLNHYGIKKVKDIADFSGEGLMRILGQYGAILKQYALGMDEREIETGQEVKSISEETTFSEDIYDRHVMLATLQEQSAGVGYRLRSRNIYAQTISIKVRFADFKTITRDITLSGATDRDSDIYRAAKDLFFGHCGKPPWRLLGVRLSGLKSSRQLSLFSQEPDGEKEERLTSLKDGLKRKYGREMVYNASKLYIKKEE